MSPLVTPATARSPEAVMEDWWTSMLTERSKHRSMGAEMVVVRWREGMKDCTPNLIGRQDTRSQAALSLGLRCRLECLASGRCRAGAGPRDRAAWLRVRPR